eukprot:UN17686
MMVHVYSLKTVSTSDGRCMGVCFCIYIFLEVLASTGQTESRLGSFHENPEYRVFPKFRRPLPYVANWRATRELLERSRDVETPFGTRTPSSPPVT